MTETLTQGLYGCVSRTGYTQTGKTGMVRLPALRGRPRYRYKDTYAAFTVSLTIEATAEQFTYWQSFWRSIGNGADPFNMTLMMDAALIYNEQFEVYPVQATGPWSASLDHNDRWTIQLDVEVPSSITYNLTECDVIWAVTSATDIIWAGSITDPADDIIGPCPSVDPSNTAEAAA